MGNNPVHMQGQLLTVTDETLPEQQGDLNVVEHEGLRIGGVQFGSRQMTRQGAEHEVHADEAQGDRADSPVSSLPDRDRDRDRVRSRILSSATFSTANNSSTATFIPLTPSATAFFEDTVTTTHIASAVTLTPATGRVTLTSATGRIGETRIRPQLVTYPQRASNAARAQHPGGQPATTLHRAAAAASLEGRQLPEGMQAELATADRIEAVQAREEIRLAADRARRDREGESAATGSSTRPQGGRDLGGRAIGWFHFSTRGDERSTEQPGLWERMKELTKRGVGKMKMKKRMGPKK
jgi:hypothetical protein